MARDDEDEDDEDEDFFKLSIQITSELKVITLIYFLSKFKIEFVYPLKPAAVVL